MKSIGANRVVYLSDTPPTLSPFKGSAVATEFITSTKTKLASAAMRAGKYGAMSLSQPQVRAKALGKLHQDLDVGAIGFLVVGTSSKINGSKHGSVLVFNTGVGLNKST